jgi:integrase
VVTIAGKNFYLGPYGSPESHEKCARLIAEWEAGGRKQPPKLLNETPGSFRVKDLILQYYRFAQIEYVDENGEPTTEVTSIRIALRRLRKLFGNVAVAGFGPKSLKLVQTSLTAEGLSRKYINDSINRIRRMFRWGASEELLPAAVLVALQTVPGLTKRRGKARQAKRVKPVADEVVLATIECLPPVVADMVRIQRLTSARPTEICSIQPGLIDRSGDVWKYEPAKHKTEHLDKDRVIFIGPRAQQILRPYLLRPAGDFCFSPSESEKARNEERRANRKSPRTPSQEARKQKKGPKAAPKNCYTTASFRRAIHRACDQAFPPPESLDEAGEDSEQTKPEKKQARVEWIKQHRWSPNRLRHTGGTEIGDKFGIEAASAVMGNTVDVAQVYVERNLKQAREIIKEVG